MRLSLLLLMMLSFAATAAEKAAVVVLLDDDAEGLIPQLTNDGESTDDPATVEKADVFAGTSALRVGGVQRFCSRLKGWNYAITEKPAAGEYRFVRFAWKKTAATATMLQLASHEKGWDHQRYVTGPEAPPWTATTLTPAAATEWVVVTRDLFKDFGAMTLTGVAFSPQGYGGDGLFDHLLLGRTVEDLDAHTLAVLKKTPPATKRTPEQLQAYWKVLGAPDDSNALWQLVARPDQAVPLLTERLKTLGADPPPAVPAATAKPLIAAATHHRFVVRDGAAQELKKLGAGVLPHLRAAAAAADGETKDRLLALVQSWDGDVGADRLRLERCRFVLDAAGTPAAKGLSARVAAYLKTPPEEKR